MTVPKLPTPVPASARAPAQRSQSRRNFLSDVVINYGPAPVLSRLFLRLDTEMRRRGINLSFASFDELLAANKANPDSWHPLVSVFDPNIGGANADNGYALIGWNADGKAVTAIAARHYPLTNCTLKEEFESLRLFYADPEASKQPGEEIRVSAPTPATTTGSIVYLGGVWFHPSYRGQGMHRVMSPIARALSYSRWQSQMACSLMVAGNVSSGVARSARFPHVEWGAHWTNSPVFGSGTLELAFVWTNADEQLQHFEEYVSESDQPAIGSEDERLPASRIPAQR